MVEIDGKLYPKDKVLKALKLYAALEDGSLEAEIKERFK